MNKNICPNVSRGATWGDQLIPVCLTNTTISSVIYCSTCDGLCPL